MRAVVKWARKVTLLCFISSSLAILQNNFVASAHSGGTDANGCHAGSQPYHCHSSSGGSSSATTAVATTTTVAPTTTTTTTTTVAPTTTTTVAPTTTTTVAPTTTTTVAPTTTTTVAPTTTTLVVIGLEKFPKRITCVKGKLSKTVKVNGPNPKCPKGWTKKA